MDQFVVDLGPGAGRRRRGRRGDPVRAGHAGRTHRAGLGRSARHHQLRGRHQSARPGRPDVPWRSDGPKPLSDNEPEAAAGARSNAPWLAGAAGLTAVGTVAGRVRRAVADAGASATDDPYEDEDFELLDADRSSVVTTPDGVDLAVREVGPEDAPLTVVFAHGFCLRMGAFYFQRARLAEQWGPQVRMVFYDQRGHGQSAEASPDTYTVEQLGKDLETVLAVMAPRGPGGAGRAFDGRHDRAVARPAVPAALSHPHRRRGADLVCRRRCFAVTAGRDPEEPGAGGGSVRGPVRPEDGAPHPRRRQVGDRPDPAGGVLRRREDQPERRGVLREDDARHADRHAGGVPARAGGARRDRGAADAGEGADPDRLR